jgi:hypothetical protein
MMATVIGILRFTPILVWAVLVLLVWLGLVSARARTVGVARLLITPIVFVAWGLVALASSKAPLGPAVTYWLIAGLCGGALGLAARLDGLRFDHRQALVQVPGSWFPMIRNLAIFVTKYALAVAIALLPDWRGTLPLWDAAVSGASSGYFLVWVVRFALAYRRARAMPAADAAAVPR